VPAWSQFGEQLADAAIDVVADSADLLDGLSGGVVELPVQIALTGLDRARVAAAHSGIPVATALWTFSMR
jgi:hypothetical protein